MDKTTISITSQKTSILSFLLTLIVVLFCQSTLLAQTTIKLDDRDEYVTAAAERFEAGNWEEGKSYVDQGLEEHPNDSDLHTLAGKYYHHKGDNDQARYHLQRALKIYPKNVDAKQILVNVETESQRYSSAICYVNELLEINPYWKGLWRKKIELYRFQGNHVEAQRLQKRISQIYPEDQTLKDDYLYSIEMEANKKAKEGKLDDAISLNKTVLREAPDSPTNYINLANTYLKAQSRDQALMYLEQGLERFPNNTELINKKAGVLAEDHRYDVLLPFLQQHGLTTQYNYYVLEAARYTKDNQPFAYYSQVFERERGNAEAFDFVFSHLMSTQDYNEALYVLNRHRDARGQSKDLHMKELAIYRLMGNRAKVNTLTKTLFSLYPEDTDIRDAYVLIKLDDAKDRMADKQYSAAIDDWYEVLMHGDEDLQLIAQNGLYNAHLELGEHFDALNVLNETIMSQPENNELYLKRSLVYFKQKNYHNALGAYEYVLNTTFGEERDRHLSGYADMQTQIIKEQLENYRYVEALEFSEQWLEHDPNNRVALQYGINSAMALKKNEQALEYAETGARMHPDHVFFIVKIAEIEGKDPEKMEEISNNLYTHLRANPYNTELINAFAQLTEDQGMYLVKDNQSVEAIEKIDVALEYAPNNNSLKYVKGLAYERLKQFDSAYYYQGFYEPAITEQKEFDQTLKYLAYKSLKNEFGIAHLRSRHGDDYTITTISTVEYTRHAEKNSFTGRGNYAGREGGKGAQVQGVWARAWNEKTSTNIDASLANRFFPKLILNASLYRDIERLKDINVELGVGYRRLDLSETTANIESEHMVNFVVGATKYFEPFTFNARLNNFFIDSEWLFNLTVNARYSLFDPKSHIIAMAGIGTSPDVELIDTQMYGRFSSMNTMVGAGYSHLLYKNISLGVLGTWYNYNSSNVNSDFRNLYNLYLDLHVAF